MLLGSGQTVKYENAWHAIILCASKMAKWLKSALRCWAFELLESRAYDMIVPAGSGTQVSLLCIQLVGDWTRVRQQDWPEWQKSEELSQASKVMALLGNPCARNSIKGKKGSLS